MVHCGAAVCTDLEGHIAEVPASAEATQKARARRSFIGVMPSTDPEAIEVLASGAMRLWGVDPLTKKGSH